MSQSIVAQTVEAAKQGDIEKLKQLALNRKYNINQKHNGRTALMEASKDGDLSCVKYLLQNGATMDLKDDNGETALMEACKNNKTEVVEYLLAYGRSLYLENKSSETALMLAVKNHAWEAVEKLLKKGADLNYKTSRRETVLVYAARNNADGKSIEKLLDLGAHSNARDKSSRSALHWAAAYGNLKSITILLQQCAQKEINTQRGAQEEMNTPVEFHQAYIEDVLRQYALQNLKDSKGQTPVMLCVGSDNLTLCADRFVENRVKCLEKIIQTPKTDIDVQDKNGETALHHSLKVALCPLIEVLLENDANPNIKDNNGVSALQLAKSAEIKKRIAIAEESLLGKNNSRYDKIKELMEQKSKACPVPTAGLFSRLRTKILESESVQPQESTSTDPFANKIREHSVPVQEAAKVTPPVHAGYTSQVVNEGARPKGEQGSAFNEKYDENSKSKDNTDIEKEERNQEVAADKYLRSVSKLITNDMLLYDIGSELDLAAREIDAIRTDNPNYIVNAGYKLLLQWRKNINSLDISVLEEKLKVVMDTCKLGSEFQKIKL